MADKVVKLSDEEVAVLKIAISNAVSGCHRSAAKAGLQLVKEAYAKQAFVLSSIQGKLTQ